MATGVHACFLTAGARPSRRANAAGAERMRLSPIGMTIAQSPTGAPSLFAGDATVRDIMYSAIDRLPAVECTPRPDHRRPLRMQVRGRSPQQTHRRWMTRQLWKRALRSRGAWRRTCRTTLPAGVVQCFIASSNGTGRWGGWMMLAVPVLTLTVGIVMAAGTQVQEQLRQAASNSN